MTTDHGSVIAGATPTVLQALEAINMGTVSLVASSLPSSSSLASTPLFLSDMSWLPTPIIPILQALPVSLVWMASTATITLPTLLFSLLSTSLTFTMNATTLLVIILIFVSLISWVVRYRILNMYARLPPEPQRKEPQVQLFPDVPAGDSKAGLANYLDEFLSAIKVFGYLERPVFHELTRTMQTRKLIAGETLLLEEEKGFCLVVDGLVQIFVKSGRASQMSEDGTSSKLSDLDEYEETMQRGHQGYQLLTEVKNGAPMSSLFSILALFTDAVKVRHDEEAPTTLQTPGPFTPRSGPGSPTNGKIRSSSDLHMMGSRTSSVASLNGELPSVPPLSLDADANYTRARRSERSRRLQQARGPSAHPDILARAIVDTTIAIIPATAFQRLTRVYPRATAHIVQVILTRLQRVTLATANKYLGLTSEVLKTESSMHSYTSHDLPNELRGGALERLKAKFQNERDRMKSSDAGMKGIALHHAQDLDRKKKKSLRINASAAETSEHTGSAARRQRPEFGSLGHKHGVSAGDLLTHIQVSRFGSRPHGSLNISDLQRSIAAQTIDGLRSPLARRERDPFVGIKLDNSQPLDVAAAVDEDDVFRESILECIFKAIGMAGSRGVVRRPTDSIEQSPRLVSYDSHRQTATFTNAFGFMAPLDGSIDGETETTLSAGTVPVNLRSLGTDMTSDLEIVFFPKDAVLVEHGERNPGLYYVIDGFLDVSISEQTNDEEPQMPDSPFSNQFPSLNRTSTGTNTLLDNRSNARQKRKNLFMVKPGGLAGYVGTVSSFRSMVDVTARTDVFVGFLPRASVEKLVERYPVILLTMAKRLTNLLPRLIQHIDFALEWVQVDAGQTLHHQGDESDAIYIVLNGRLRAIMEDSKKEVRVVGEYGQGESVGELEVLTESRRPANLHAIRDTEIAKFPKSLFNSLALEHPGITIKISKIIAQRMRALIENPIIDQRSESGGTTAHTATSSTLNLRTVAVLPVHGGVPVVEFASRLLTALGQVGVTNGVTLLNQAAILSHLGRHAFSKMGKLKLSQYLADLEERYGMLLYIADTNVNSPWTQTCITQADSILLVGIAEGSPSIGEYERFLLGMKTTARKDLVLLHAERYSPAGLTRKWLQNRVWINGGHHHVQMAFNTNEEPTNSQNRRFGDALKQRVQVLQAEIQKYTSRRVRHTPFYASESPHKGDFHRLARRLCGKSVGLVLGGGGARGIAQIGVIRAIEEAGLPIDIVGGTSIGAFNGALYSRYADVVPMYGRAKKFAGRMGSMWRFAFDLTYPSASYTTGHEFNRGIFKTFGQSQIEDFWLEFYCNTTNISKSRMEFHTSGYVWRYVRASMSLAGLIPPMCDEGSMLLDGGYMDNLTVAHMKSLGADTIIAIDVGSIDDNSPQMFGDSLSGYWAAFNRWNPFSSYPNPPTLSEIQARLAYVSSVDALERAKAMAGCLYMRPPIDQYGTLEFGKFDEIYQVGYKYGREYLEALRKKGLLPVMEETEERRQLRRTMAPRRASI